MEIEYGKLKLPIYASYSKRNRLYDELNLYHEASLILVLGDSGYGKTTLVSSYIREKNIPTVWYRLAATDRYAHIFLSYLKAGIVDLMGEDYSVETAEPENMEMELELIATFLSKQKTPIYIVLDDYQWVDSSPEIGPIIAMLLNRASPMVTFIITSRVRPQFSTTKLKMEQRYKEITTSDIAFTLEETAEFYNDINDLDLEDHEIRLIHERTEGWIASYQLILGVIFKMNRTQRAMFWSTFPNVQDIYDYLSTEVIEAQHDDVKLFLYRTSLLPELDPAVINKFLEINNAEQILNDLLNQHLFIYRDDQGVFRYHRLFRQYLYENYKEQTSDESLVKEHRQLAIIYENSYQLINAFAHYTVGKAYLKATEVMGMIRTRYNPVESMILLDGRLDEISPNESFASNTLFIIRCIPFAVLKELKILFEESIARLKKEENKLWLCSLQHRLATICLVSGDIIRAKELFLQSLEGSEQFHDHAMSSFNLTLLAEIYRYLGKYTKAIECVRKSLFLSDERGMKHTQIQALDTMATIFLDYKKVEEASPYIHQALQIAEESDHSSLLFVYTTMGKLFSIKGEAVEAIKWGKKAVALAESYHVDFDKGWSTFELGKSYLEIEQLDEAEKYFEKASKAFTLSALYYCLVGISQLKLYEKRNKVERAIKKRTELRSLLKTNNFYWLLHELEETQDGVEASPQFPLSIRTLGNFEISYEKEPIVIKRRSSLRLLQYFITNRNKRIERDIILEAVFAEGTLETIQNQFHVSLSVLRKLLEPALTSGTQSRYIKRFGNHYLFCTKEVDLDIEHMTSLASVTEDDNEDELILRYEKAVELYKGDYFEEYPYESFLELERESIKKSLLKMIRVLAKDAYDKKEFNRFFDHFEVILKRDPFEEHAYFDYIKLLLQQDFESKAVAVADEMTRLFAEEMGIDVEDELSSLFLKYNRKLSSL